MSNRKTGSSWSHQFRIIGGEWRGRKFSFPAQTLARPTGDRIRETLFNWLQNHLIGARCLDLFAGSGALGLEALSRGASEVIFVDNDVQLIKAIEEHLSTLACKRAVLACQDAESWIEQYNGLIDIIFLDPPFADQKLTNLCKLLDSRDMLADDALCYLEQAASDPMPMLPAGWQVRKEKRAGQVRYALIERSNINSTN